MKLDRTGHSGGPTGHSRAGPVNRRHFPGKLPGLLAAVAAALLAGCGGAPARPPLTVLAAASLAGPFGDLADSLRARLPGQEVRLAFAGSHQIALQVEEGAPCDLVAMADSAWTGRLARAGRLQDPPILFATNSLVVAVPSSNPAGLTTPADLARPRLKIVLGTGESPIGRYARRVIARLALATGSPPGFERRVLANVVSEEQDAGAIAAKLRLGEADAAFLYRSDLPAGISAIAIPDSLNQPAIYAAAVPRGAPDTGAAHAFLDLLRSEAGQAVLRRHGFGPPP